MKVGWYWFKMSRFDRAVVRAGGPKVLRSSRLKSDVIRHLLHLQSHFGVERKGCTEDWKQWWEENPVAIALVDGTRDQKL